MKIQITKWGIVTAVVVGMFSGLSGYTFLYAKGLSYFSKDPAACANCHIMQPQFDSWQKSSHHTSATCVDCHLPHDLVGKWVAKAENGYWHSKGFTFQDFPEPIFIREKNLEILHHNCVDCHKGLVHEILPGLATEEEEYNCTHCHRSVGHGETVGMGKYEPVNKSQIIQNK